MELSNACYRIKTWSCRSRVGNTSQGLRTRITLHLHRLVLGFKSDLEMEVEFKSRSGSSINLIRRDKLNWITCATLCRLNYLWFCSQPVKLQFYACSFIYRRFLFYLKQWYGIFHFCGYQCQTCSFWGCF